MIYLGNSEYEFYKENGEKIILNIKDIDALTQEALLIKDDGIDIFDRVISYSED